MDSRLFIIEGGVGKCIAGTAVARAIKKAYPEDRLIVACGYPEIFQNNKHVAKAYHFSSMSNFYNEEIKERNAIVMKSEPYIATNYLYGEEHISKVWCEQLGIPYDRAQPEINLFKSELDRAYSFISGFTKPVLLLQAFGGRNPEKADMSSYLNVYGQEHRRDLPIKTVVELYTKLKDKYQFVLMKMPNQPAIDSTMFTITAPLRSLMALLPFTKKRIFIDSFMQHAASALKIPSVVIWGGTSPKRVGYDIHKNMELKEACSTPHCHRPNSYLFDNEWQCSYGEACLNQPVDNIITALGE